MIDAYWLASAFWYSSLVLAILGILLPAQQITVFQILGKPPAQMPDEISSHGASTERRVRRFLPLILSEVHEQDRHLEGHHGRSSIGMWKPRWKMGFIWQCPSMFMSYSVCSFLAGLTIYMCTPLIRNDGWDTGSSVG